MKPAYQAMLEKNLDYMLAREPEDPEFWGPKIKYLCERLGV